MAFKPVSGPSREEADENCGYQFKLKYVDKVKTIDDFANLVFGDAIHWMVEQHLKAEIFGTPSRPEEVFVTKFEKLTAERIVEYSSIWDPDDLKATGVALARAFPAFWRQQNLVVMEDAEGPLLERDLELEYPDFIIRIKVDIVAMRVDDGEAICIDAKSPATPSFDGFEYVAEQLTDYNLVLDAHAERLGFDRIGGLGFMEGIKKKMPKTRRGELPSWRMSDFAPPRSPAALAERIEKHRRMIANHQQGWYPKRPRMAFNSPCKLCSFRDFCFTGKTDGLVFPNGQQPLPAAPPPAPLHVAAP